jgi:hypothetical protein
MLLKILILFYSRIHNSAILLFESSSNAKKTSVNPNTLSNIMTGIRSLQSLNPIHSSQFLYPHIRFYSRNYR